MDFLPKAFEGKIDFEGQKLADVLNRWVLIALTILSFIAGFGSQSLTICFSIFTLGTIILALLVVPPWPYFNKHPFVWLPSKSSEKKIQ